MAQGDNPRKIIAKICQNLARDLDKAGLSNCIDLRMTNDPVSDL